MLKVRLYFFGGQSGIIMSLTYVIFAHSDVSGSQLQDEGLGSGVARIFPVGGTGGGGALGFRRGALTC